MLVTTANLDGLFRGFSTSFDKGFQNAPTHYADVAMTTPSSTAEQTYAWLGQLPRMREWLGDRHLHGLAAHGFAIKNRRWESTIEVARTEIEDDQYGIYGPLFTELGRTSAELPDELVFGLLAAGFATACYDGQNFFDTEHPVKNKAGEAVVVSNMTAGAAPPWFLLDTSRAIRPLIFQERLKPTLGKMDRDEDQHVFMQDKYIYGTRSRSNVGFGLWQLAHGSKAVLDKDSYKAAREAMTTLRGEEGRPLGISPNVLVVPPELEEAGLSILNATQNDAGASNVWSGTAKLLVTPWLAD